MNKVKININAKTFRLKGKHDEQVKQLISLFKKEEEKRQR